MYGIHLNSREMMNIKFTITVAVFASLSLVGCVSTKIHTRTTAEARTNILKEADSIAIFPFDGETKEEPAATLEHTLMDAYAVGATKVRLVDRKNIENIKNEIKLNKDGDIDKNSVKKRAALIGAEYLLLGRVLTPSISSAKNTHQESACEAYEESKKFFKKCKQPKLVNVTCTTTTVRVKVQPRLVRLSSGEVVYARMYEGAVEDNHCENTGAPTPDAVLKAQATILAAIEISKDLWPFVYTISTAIKPSAEGLFGPDREKFDSAIAFARADRMDRFCTTMKNFNQANIRTVSTVYNHAVCEESKGQITNARAILEELDASLSYPDKDVSEALIRLRNFASAAMPDQGNGKAAQ